MNKSIRLVAAALVAALYTAWSAAPAYGAATGAQASPAGSPGDALPTPPPPPPMQTAPAGVATRPDNSAVPPAPPPGPAVQGQWVLTPQYGWLWMPYAADYTYVSGNGSEAYMYVYSTGYGWRWVLSPWVIGLGPRPWWGAPGVARFAWYAHPWFHAGLAHRGYLHARPLHRG
jgi:hypothetical protein